MVHDYSASRITKSHTLLRLTTCNTSAATPLFAHRSKTNAQALLCHYVIIDWNRSQALPLPGLLCSQPCLSLTRGIMLWWVQQDSDLRPPGYEPDALPTELWTHTAAAST